MKKIVGVDDICRNLYDGFIKQVIEADQKLAKLTRDATSDNLVSVGDYIVQVKHNEFNDIGLVMLMSSISLERIVAIEEQLKSIKKLLKSNKSK